MKAVLSFPCHPYPTKVQLSVTKAILRTPPELLIELKTRAVYNRSHTMDFPITRNTQTFKIVYLLRKSYHRQSFILNHHFFIKHCLCFDKIVWFISQTRKAFKWRVKLDMTEWNNDFESVHMSNGYFHSVWGPSCKQNEAFLVHSFDVTASLSCQIGSLVEIAESVSKIIIFEFLYLINNNNKTIDFKVNENHHLPGKKTVFSYLVGTSNHT